MIHLKTMFKNVEHILHNFTFPQGHHEVLENSRLCGLLEI